MRRIWMALAMPWWLLCADVFYAKVEPIESVVIKAAVAGSVVEARTQDEGKEVTQVRIVHLDDKVERYDLNATREEIRLTRAMIALNEETLKVQRETLRRQKAYYERMKRLPTASQTQKDNAFSAYAAAENQVAVLEEKVLNLRSKLNTLRNKAVRLEDTIAKKSIVVSGYLYRLMVRKGDYVAPGTPVARVDDTSRAKLVFFVPPEMLKGIENKRVYLDGKRTPYRVDKVWRVTDETYMSSYRVEIDIDAPETFSKLMKVELK